jgi:hypothetical protein
VLTGGGGGGALVPAVVCRPRGASVATFIIGYPRHCDYPTLALQFAPLMFDAIHFTYYWVPCALSLVLALVLTLDLALIPTPTLTPTPTPTRIPALAPTRCRASRPSPRWLASSHSSRCNTRSAGPCRW